MKKLFTLIALAAMAFAAQADVLTVAEGTGEAQYAPFYGFQMDAIGSISQVIYPADMLADMNGGTITGVKFYPTQAFGALGSGNLQISLKEVEQDRYTSTTLVTDATVVGNAYPVQGNTEWVIDFDTPFEYHGGNLMIETELIQVGSFKATKFFGKAFSYAVGIAQYKYSWGTDYYYEAEQVLPKATFTYEGGGAPVEHTYTVAGTESLFGSNWNPEDETNDMVKGEGGIYTWTKNDVEMNMGDVIEFKVVEDHSWTNNWPGENYKYTFPYDDTYDIVITFNPANEEINFTAIGHNPVVPEMVYTVVGPQDIFGSEWAPADTTNNMVKDEDGIYIWSKDDVALYGDFSFKVVGNHSYDIYQWPTVGNWDAHLTEGEGIYGILITFDPEAEPDFRITCTLIKTGSIAPVEHTYTVAGSDNLFGSFWNPADTANDMVKGEDGIYTWTKDDVVFDDAATIEFRIVQDHAWTYAWPSGNWAINDVTEAGTYSFVITFNPAADDAEKIHVTVTKATQGLRGDVNDDTKVDITDATLLINYLLYGDATDINLDNANCDLQEGVDISDATALINFLLYGTWGD